MFKIQKFDKRKTQNFEFRSYQNLGNGLIYKKSVSKLYRFN